MRVVPTFDPFEHGHLRFRLTFEPTTVQQLTLERGKEALRHRIIVCISHGAHRGHDARFAATLAERVARVLGGFKCSLQHFNDGGCDDISKTAVGSFRTRQVVLARPADGRACGATAVLGRDCGGTLERTSSSSCSGIVTGWGTLVSGVRRYAAIASKTVDATAVGTISVVRGA
jgi:hypothetical protein